MVREINNLGGVAVTPASAEKTSGKAGESAVASNPDSASSSADDVQISEQGLALQALADKAAALPDANLEKAGLIKAAIESGQYQIDELVLADKILNAESLLG